MYEYVSQYESLSLSDPTVQLHATVRVVILLVLVMVQSYRMIT